MPNLIDCQPPLSIKESVLDPSFLYSFNYDVLAEKLGDEDLNWDLESMTSDPFETLQNASPGSVSEQLNDPSWDAINAWLFESADNPNKDIKQESLSPTHTSSSSLMSEIEVDSGITSASQPSVQTFDINTLICQPESPSDIPVVQLCASNDNLSLETATSTAHFLNDAFQQLTTSLNESQYRVYQKFKPIKPKTEQNDAIDKQQSALGTETPFAINAPTGMPGSTLKDQNSSGDEKPKVVSKRRSNTEPEFEQRKSRKQDRMARNRESALQSRQKKKEWMQTLEMRLAALSNVNSNLKFENDALKEKVRSLESENTELKSKKQIDVPDLAKKTSCVLVLFVFLAVNMKPMSSFSSSQADSLQNYQSPMRHGRFLLEHNKATGKDTAPQYAISGKDDSKTPSSSESLMDILNRNVIRKVKRLYRLQDKIKRKEIAAATPIAPAQLKANETSEDPNCSKSYNKTEVFRLNEALERLVKVHKKKTRKQKTKKVSDRVVKLNALKTLLMPGINCSDSISHGANCSKNMTKKSNSLLRKQPQLSSSDNPTAKSNELQTIQYDWSVFERFQKSIRRDPNTFYFVSFRRDHILLPPLQLNETQRPRVSFIFPGSNSTPSIWSSSNDKVSLIKIDCQVMDTKIFDIPKQNIPRFNLPLSSFFLKQT